MLKRFYYQIRFGKPNVVNGDKGDDWEVPEEMIPAASSLGSFSRRDNTLPVQNQGKTNTCVGQTAKICMQDTVDYRDGEELSPMYIYHWAQRMDEWEGEAYEGTSISGACKALVEKGNVFEKTWPNGIDAPPTSIAILEEEGSRRKLKAYYKVNTQDLKFEDKIKGLLKNESLLVSFRISDYFYSIPKTGIIDSDDFREAKVEQLGHACPITGWKEINGETHWEMQNSWGTGWGDQGRCFFPNSLLKEHMLGSEARVGGVYYLITQKEEQGEIPFEYEKKSKKTMLYVVGGIGGFLLIGWLISLLT
jgi:hypothetical protein